VWRDYRIGCAKTAEPIKLSYRIVSRFGPRYHILDGRAVHIGATLQIHLNDCARDLNNPAYYFYLM